MKGNFLLSGAHGIMFVKIHLGDFPPYAISTLLDKLPLN